MNDERTDRGNRSVCRLAVAGVALAIVMAGCGGGSTPSSGPRFWDRDDPCNTQTNPPADSYYSFFGTSLNLHRETGYSASPGNCFMWAPTQVSTRVNYAAMYLPTNRNYDGRYDFFAFIPCNSHSNTQKAKYESLPEGTAAGVTATKLLNQDAACNGSKLVFDNQVFHGTNGGYVRLRDVTTESGRNIAWDYDYYYPA